MKPHNIDRTVRAALGAAVTAAVGIAIKKAKGTIEVVKGFVKKSIGA